MLCTVCKLLLFLTCRSSELASVVVRRGRGFNARTCPNKSYWKHALSLFYIFIHRIRRYSVLMSMITILLAHKRPFLWSSKKRVLAMVAIETSNSDDDNSWHNVDLHSST